MFCVECVDEYAQPDSCMQKRKGHFTWEKYFHFNNKVSKAQRYTPIVPALGRLRHADIEFKALLGYITRLPQQTRQNQSHIVEMGTSPFLLFHGLSFNFAYLS